MIKLEMNTGILGIYLRAYLTIGSTRIDLGDGNSMNKIEVGEIVAELETVVESLREFAGTKEAPDETD